MKKPLLFCLGLSIALGAFLPARADKHLSADRLNALDRDGYLTPNFKAAVRDLVTARQDLQKAQAEQKQFERDLPGLQQQAADAQAKAVALRQELARYDHPEENDFIELEGRMKDPAAVPEEVIALAQAYVWTYPTNPHEAEAQQYLAMLQRKIADQKQAEKDAEAAREAAHARLVQRAQARDLSLVEWRGLLRGMSQDDLVKLFGQPSSKDADYWYYEGEWVVNPSSNRKVGMQINFDAGRVLTVDPRPPPP
jgi:hypothetical protein